MAVKIGLEGVGGRTVAEEAASMQALGRRITDAARWFVVVRDVGKTTSGRPFYVMPLFERALAELLVPTVPLLVRLDVLAQACFAVEMLHGASTPDQVLVHRDIKPSNILIRDGERPSVHLSDFGGLREDALLSSETHTTIVTPQYAPPEQYLPLKGEPDPAMDVFALAAVVYEGVTGMDVPEASFNAIGWHGPLGRELFRFARRRGGLTEPEKARFEELRVLPPDRLVDATRDAGLTDGEVYRIRNAVGDSVDGTSELADYMVERLVPVLRDALHPDPRRRAGSAKPLRQACVQAHDRLARERGLAPWGPPAEPTLPPPVPPQPAGDRLWVWSGAAAILGAVMAASASVAVFVGITQRTPVVATSSAPGPEPAVDLIEPPAPEPVTVDVEPEPEPASAVEVESVARPVPRVQPSPRPAPAVVPEPVVVAEPPPVEPATVRLRLVGFTCADGGARRDLRVGEAGVVEEVRSATRVVSLRARLVTDAGPAFVVLQDGDHTYEAAVEPGGRTAVSWSLAVGFD